jgi:TPR repeat protein
MYAEGLYLPQDDRKAAQWYRKAARQGLAMAMVNLGMMYSNGRGLPQDYVLAHMWINLSIARGRTDAVASRDALADRMTPAQLNEAQDLARMWTPRSNDH